MEQTKKYEITGEKRTLYRGVVVNRIRALRDFEGVRAGTLGGWIQSEKNLSQEGGAWIADDAAVLEDATVSNYARVCNDAMVFGNAQILGASAVSGNARVFENARVSEYAMVGENAWIYGNAKVSGCGVVNGYARVSENAVVTQAASMNGRAVATDDAILSGTAMLTEYARICRNAKVCGCVHVYGNAQIGKDAFVKYSTDYAVVQGFGRVQRATSFFRRKDGSVGVRCGCFYGSLQEFREKVRETYENNKLAKEYLAIADLMELHFDLGRRG